MVGASLNVSAWIQYVGTRAVIGSVSSTVVVPSLVLSKLTKVRTNVSLCDDDLEGSERSRWNMTLL